jgi:hypothetical protein
VTFEQLVDSLAVGERIPAGVVLPEPTIVAPSASHDGPVGGIELPLGYEPTITEAEIAAVARGGDGSEAWR